MTQAEHMKLESYFGNLIHLEACLENDRPAFEMGYDYGWFNQTMLTWREYTQGNPGYNYSWGSYKRGYAKGQEDRNNLQMRR